MRTVVTLVILLVLTACSADREDVDVPASATATPSAAAAAAGIRTAAPGVQSASIPAPADLQALRSFRSVRPRTRPKPRAIAIPAIDVRGRLSRTGRNPDGSLEVPTFGRMSWYAGGARPGQRGPAAILGHVDSKTGPDVFFRLHELRRGDSIMITRTDGSRLTFVVDRVERHPKDEFPRREVWFPTTEPELRLITCGGTFDEQARSYRDNVIVFASLRS